MASIRQNLKNEGYRQYSKSHNSTRHDRKIATGKHAHHDVLNKSSFDNYKARIKLFADWLKREYTEIKRIEEIDREMVIEYLSWRQNVYLKPNCKHLSPSTISTDQWALNHVLAGRKVNREEPVNKREWGGLERSRNGVINNRTPRMNLKGISDDNIQMIGLGRAFGLRRSELLVTKANHFVTNKSLYKTANKRLYCATIGKGGRFRVIEATEVGQAHVEAYFGDLVQDVCTKDEIPSESEYKEVRRESEPLFTKDNHNLQIHMYSRQGYSSDMLEQLERCDGGATLTDSWKVNGMIIRETHARRIENNLGHSDDRYKELSRYLFPDAAFNWA